MGAALILDAKERFAAAQMARADLYFFARWMFARRRGYQWQRAPHHRKICDALMRVFRGECKRLIINIPPRYSKTELAVVMFIAWALGHVPDAEFIHTSYSSTLAANNSASVRALVQHEAYREVFAGVTLADEARAHWTTTAGGVMYATGAGGTITGFGAGKHRPGFGGAIIIDDPHKADVGAILAWGFAPWTGGPITYIDQIGLKAFVEQADKYAAQYGDRFTPPQLLRDMAAKGETFYGNFEGRKAAA